MEERKLKYLGLLEKISFVFILFLAFFAPLFFIPKSFISIQYGSSILIFSLILISFIFWLISGLISGKVILPSEKKYLVPIFVLVPLVYILSFLVNGFSRVSLLGYTFDITTVGFLIVSFMFMFITAIIFNSKEKIFYGYIASILSSILLGIFIVIRIIFGQDILSFGVFGSSITSTVLGSWNNVSIFFGISAILSLISYEMLSLSRFMKVILTVSLIISLFFLAVVNFNVTWIALAFIVLVFLIYKLYLDGKFALGGFKNLSKYSLVIFSISLLFVLFSSQLGSLMFKITNISNIDVRPNIGTTYDIARQIIKEKPILGSGPNTFAMNWLSNKPDDINSTIFWNTDFSFGVGLLPTMILTTGFVGLLSWILFFIAFLYIGLRILFNHSDDKFRNYIGVSSFLVSVFLWIMSFMYIPSSPLFVLTIFFTGLTLGFYYFTNNKLKTIVFKDVPKLGFISSFSLVFLLILSLVLSFAFYRNSSSLWDFQKALSLSTSDLSNAEILVDRAISKVPYDIYYRTKSDISILKIQNLLNQDLSKAKPEDVRNFFLSELAKSIDFAMKAKDSNKNNYINWIALAKAYQIAVPEPVKINGAYENSLNAYSEGLKLNPKNPAIYMLLARLELDNKNVKKAKEYIAQSINLKQNYLDPYFLLAQIQASEGNVKEAINSVSATTLIDPNNPALYFQLGLLQYNISDYLGAVDSFRKSVSIVNDYANAKYFLGLSLYRLGNIYDAIKEFEDIARTNPDNKEVASIIANLKEGRGPFTSKESSSTNTKPETRKNLPVR